METLNSVKRLLLFLENHGPGQWVIITNELGKIFPLPEFRFKYSEYADQIKSFLTGVESEGLVQVKIGNQNLFDSAFGDLNNVFCDLEKHDIRAKITMEGLGYIGILGAPSNPMFYLSRNAQLIFQSSDSNIVNNNISSQGSANKKASLFEKIRRIAKSIIAAKAILIAIFSFLTSFGIFFSLWKTNKLAALSILFHTTSDKDQKPNTESPALSIWPSNLKYIDFDTVAKLYFADLIAISWVKGHSADSMVAQKLYTDLKDAGYKLQQIQELAFIDNTEFKGTQFKVDAEPLHGKSRRINVTINPKFNFLKE